VYRQVWNEKTRRWGTPKKLDIHVTSDNRHLYELLYGKLRKNFWRAYGDMCLANKALDETE
jgi:hypothetical protein